MEFFFRLETDQVNIILKGLETLRESAVNTHAYLVQQATAQSQARNAPPAPVTPSNAVTDASAPVDVPMPETTPAA